MSNIRESISVLYAQGIQVLGWLNSGLRSTTLSDTLTALKAARKRQEQLVESLSNLQQQLGESPAPDMCISDSVVASCQCGVKTPDIQHHAVGCKYRLIVERDDAREQLQTVKQELNARLIERTEGFLSRVIELRTNCRELERELKTYKNDAQSETQDSTHS